MTHPTSFRLALVGAGLITQEAHLPAALASDLIEVTAIVDPVPGRADALAREYGLTARTSASLDAVLGHVDGAIIATPNDSHATLGMQCVRAGVAALIEKPLCTTFADAEELVNAAERAGTTLATGYATRFRDSTVFLRELLDAGEFGTVTRFVHQFGSLGGWGSLSAYTLDRKAAGGGVLVVTGTHFLDRMIYLWGYPDDCQLQDDGINGPEANAMATFRYTSDGRDIRGCGRYSKTGALPGGLVIETASGLLRLADRDDAELTLFPRTNPSVALTVRRNGPPRFSPRVSVFQHQLDDFVTATRQHRAPMVDGRQGMASIRLLESLYAERRTLAQTWYPERETT